MRRVFEPLEYSIEVGGSRLDNRSPDWGWIRVTGVVSISRTLARPFGSGQSSFTRKHFLPGRTGSSDRT